MLYRIAFSQVKGMHPKVAEQMLERVGTEEEFFRLPAQSLHRLTGNAHHVHDDDYRAAVLEGARREEGFLVRSRMIKGICSAIREW